MRIILSCYADIDKPAFRNSCPSGRAVDRPSLNSCHPDEESRNDILNQIVGTLESRGHGIIRLTNGTIINVAQVTTVKPSKYDPRCDNKR